MPLTTLYPFETSFAEIESNIDAFIDAVFSTLQSSFLLLPRGPGFVTYPEFQQAYEVLKRHSLGFTAVEPGNVMNALQENGLAFLVLRTILGFTPPELAYITSQQSEVVVSQGFARNDDRQTSLYSFNSCTLGLRSSSSIRPFSSASVRGRPLPA